MRFPFFRSESRLTFLPQFDFESLLRLVASDSNAIVPVVSFKEIPRSDWKRLPELVASGFNGTAKVVVCTHLDQVSQTIVDEELKTVAKTFWPRGVLDTSRVIPCSLRNLLTRKFLEVPFWTIRDRRAVGSHVCGPLSSIPCAEQQSSTPPKI